MKKFLLGLVLSVAMLFSMSVCCYADSSTSYYDENGNRVVVYVHTTSAYTSTKTYDGDSSRILTEIIVYDSGVCNEHIYTYWDNGHTKTHTWNRYEDDVLVMYQLSEYDEDGNLTFHTQINYENGKVDAIWEYTYWEGTNVVKTQNQTIWSGDALWYKYYTYDENGEVLTYEYNIIHLAGFRYDVSEGTVSYDEDGNKVVTISGVDTVNLGPNTMVIYYDGDSDVVLRAEIYCDDGYTDYSTYTYYENGNLATVTSYTVHGDITACDQTQICYVTCDEDFDGWQLTLYDEITQVYDDGHIEIIYWDIFYDENGEQVWNSAGLFRLDSDGNPYEYVQDIYDRDTDGTLLTITEITGSSTDVGVVSIYSSDWELLESYTCEHSFAFTGTGAISEANIYTCQKCGFSCEGQFINPFTDVRDRSKWYFNAVLWAVEEGITTGTSSTTFSPSKSCTRAQAVTFLYRFAGSPAVSGTNNFTDVKSGTYYASAVAWAVEQGITNGTSKTKFSPTTTCNRAMIVTFLYRYDSTL